MLSTMVTTPRRETVPDAPTPIPDAAKPFQMAHSRLVSPATAASMPSRMCSKAGVARVDFAVVPVLL